MKINFNDIEEIGFFTLNSRYFRNLKIILFLYVTNFFFGHENQGKLQYSRYLIYKSNFNLGL